MYHIKDDKRSRESGTMMVQGLLRLIGRKPYASITVLELTEEAQVGRTTFYRNFDTIDDVLRLECDRKLAEFAVVLKAILKNSPLGPSTPLTRPFLEFWAQDSSLVETLLKAGRTDIFKAALEQMVETLKLALSPLKDPLIQPYVQDIKIAIAMTLLTRWVQNGKVIEPRQFVEAIEKMLRQGDQPMLM